MIGYLAGLAEKEGFDVYMMTPDKDYAQLVTEKVQHVPPGPQGIRSKFGVLQKCASALASISPMQVIDLLGLMGDSQTTFQGCRALAPRPRPSC